jgi:hypothetical protein
MRLELVFFPGHEGYSASSHDVLAGILTESERPHQDRRQYRYYIPRHGQGISSASSKFPVFRAHRRQKRQIERSHAKTPRRKGKRRKESPQKSAEIGKKRESRALRLQKHVPRNNRTRLSLWRGRQSRCVLLSTSSLCVSFAAILVFSFLCALASWREVFFFLPAWRAMIEKLSAQEILQRLMKLIRRFQMRDMSDIGQLHQARAGNLGGGFPG